MNIENLSDDVLCAYLDGELSIEARAALERQLLGEPGARVRLDRLRESDERLRRAFALPADTRTDPLVDLLRGVSTSAPAPSTLLPTPIHAQASRWRRYALPAGLAMAAAIGGLAVGLQWRTAPMHDGGDVAMSSGLRDALDRNPSGAAHNGVLVVLSFRNHAGAACRQFETLDDGGASEGVACRDGSRWRMAAWRERSAAKDGFRTAGGEDSPVEQAVDALDDSGPLSSAEEAALMAKGWTATPAGAPPAGR